MPARRRYEYVGLTNERLHGYQLHAFSANIDIPCESGIFPRHDIPAGDVFTRTEINQRIERFSRFCECQVCRPFTLYYRGDAEVSA